MRLFVRVHAAECRTGGRSGGSGGIAAGAVGQSGTGCVGVQSGRYAGGINNRCTSPCPNPCISRRQTSQTCQNQHAGFAQTGTCTRQPACARQQQSGLGRILIIDASLFLLNGRATTRPFFMESSFVETPSDFFRRPLCAVILGIGGTALGSLGNAASSGSHTAAPIAGHLHAARSLLAAASTKAELSRAI